MDLMEMLKSLFGDEALTFEQFCEKVENATDIKLGNLASGQYVDKHKYDELNTQYEDVNNQLKNANEKYADYDPEWKTKLEQAQADGEKKLNDYKFEQAVENAIVEAGAVDVVSVKANLDMTAIVPGENGAVEGLSEPHLFGSGKADPTLNLGGPTPGTKKTKTGGLIGAVKDHYKK